MTFLYLKHLMLGTPLEPIGHALRGVLELPRRMRHPELREIHLEDKRIRLAMKAIVRPNSNCIDVGAHIGSTLSHMLALAPHGRHWAFEAVADKAGWLQRKFPQVNVRQLAVGDHEGEVVFTQNLSRPGFSGMDSAQQDGDRVRTVTVPLTRLDCVLPGDYHADFIKVDVEGAEAAVFRGACELLARCRPTLLFESSPRNAKQGGASIETLFDLLAGYGYQIFMLKDFLSQGSPLDVDAFAAAHRYPFQAFNYIAAHTLGPAPRTDASTAADASGQDAQPKSA